jgi:hypothetical protein
MGYGGNKVAGKRGNSALGFDDQQTGLDLLHDQVDLIVVAGRRHHHRRLTVVQLLEATVDDGHEVVVTADLGDRFGVLGVNQGHGGGSRRGAYV